MGSGFMLPLKWICVLMGGEETKSLKYVFFAETARRAEMETVEPSF